MAFTEFYAQTTGDNLNAGSTATDAATLTYAGGTWVSGTGVFTVASGDPVADGVAVGDFASIYTTAGATVATFIARVTARTTTTITVSLSAIAGSAAAPSATGAATTCKVGGAWKGPNAAVMFPFGFMTATLTNSSSDTPRVNFKSGTSYSITAGVTHSIAGPVVFQGYTTTVGDGGRATIDGGSASAINPMLSLSGASNTLRDLIWTNDPASGSSAYMVLVGGAYFSIERCVFHDCRGIGLYTTASTGTVLECEAYNCNKANSSNYAGFYCDGGTTNYIRTISHNNSGSNTHGFYVTTHATFVDCIAESNGANGVYSSLSLHMNGCDVYANGSDGVKLANTTSVGIHIENTNFCTNGGYGINGSGSGGRRGGVTNCGFGSGTAANTSGTTTGLKGIYESGSVTYGTDLLPWVDAPNGDFRVNLAAAKGAGRGTFTQTASSYAGAVGYPDIGSNQHQDAGGGSGGVIGGPNMRAGMMA